MNAARFSQTVASIVAVSLLAACSDKPDGQTPEAVTTRRSLPASATAGIAAEDASQHVGQTRTVCGVVASGRYATRMKGQPTFLNLGQPYPKQVFTVVIWGKDRPQFPEPPETFYRAKRISVTGRIEEYRGKPQMVVKRPAQILVNE